MVEYLTNFIELHNNKYITEKTNSEKSCSNGVKKRKNIREIQISNDNLNTAVMFFLDSLELIDFIGMG